MREVVNGVRRMVLLVLLLVEGDGWLLLEEEERTDVGRHGCFVEVEGR